MRESFQEKSTKSFQLIGGKFECVPFKLVNHLPGAAVVSGCVADGTLLGGIAASAEVGLTSCVVTVAVIVLLVVRVMAVISCFGLSLGVNGS